MKTKYKRRNFFIKKGLQGKYVLSYFIFVMLGVIFFTLIFSMLSMNTLSIVYDDYDLQIGTTPLILLEKILASQWIFMAIFAMLFVVIISILLTHRIAGPMYRFEQAFNEMINGNIGYWIKLRKKDEGKELAEKINRFNDILSEKLKATNRLVDEIDRSLEVFSRAGKLEEMEGALNQAKDVTSRIKGTFSDFKLDCD